MLLLSFVFCFFVAISSSKLPDCGKTPIHPIEANNAKIVGGRLAKPYSWPWQVEICVERENGTCAFHCGGSIIDEQWILSAAHCVNKNKLKIKVGTYKYLDDNETGEIVFDVIQSFMHPLFTFENSYDVSLFKINGTIKFSNHIQPVCVARNVSNIVHKGKYGFVTGWGTTSYTNITFPLKLKQAKVPFLEQSECIKEYEGETIIDDTLLCAGKKGIDHCFGDSGGPLVTKHSNGRWFQAGIVSFAIGCGNIKGFVGVYSRPSAACDFIKNTIGSDICQ